MTQQPGEAREDFEVALLQDAFKLPPRKTRAIGDAPVEQPGVVDSSAHQRQVTPQTARQNANIALYLPVSLMERVVSHHDSSGRSYANLVMDAVEATYARLPDLLAQSLSRPEVEASTTLFDRPMSQSVPVSEPSSRMQVEMRRAHVDVLDQIKDDLGAPNRSALLRTAITAYLDDLDQPTN